MTKEQLAEIINGREYREELTRDEERRARENNLVVVFGASDDLMEFRGGIHEELSAWDGTTAFLIRKKGIWEPINENEYDEYCDTLDELSLKEQLENIQIKAVWSPEIDGIQYSWLIKTDIPHSTFDIVEDEDYYCRGIVFSLNDL